MNKLQNYLTDLANSNVAVTNSKVEQKAARAIKESVMVALNDALASIATDEIRVVRTADGVAVVVDNESAGFITIAVNAVVKDLNYDADFEAEDFNAKREAAKAKAEAQAAEKARKIARSKAEREAKAKAKAEQA
jgi:hypothetical protein